MPRRAAHEKKHKETRRRRTDRGARHPFRVRSARSVPSHERAHRRADADAGADRGSHTHAHPVPAGTYTYVDADGGEWKLELRDDGLFTITDPDGKPHTGEGWSTAADGSVHCGPTDIYFAPFAYNGGCSRWSVTGSTCQPLERAG